MREQNLPYTSDQEMRVQELITNEGFLEMAVQKVSRESIIFFKNSLFIFKINALFKLYLAIICSMCINTLQIVCERA